VCVCVCVCVSVCVSVCEWMYYDTHLEGSASYIYVCVCVCVCVCTHQASHAEVGDDDGDDMSSEGVSCHVDLAQGGGVADDPVCVGVCVCVCV